MKFDLHCHTKEGSLDSKVPVAEFANKFRMLGFDGFMISDHNSYRGCHEWDRLCKDPDYKRLTDSITVIRGIEYDTKDAGHILVIMPDKVYLKILRFRGMRCRHLIRMVHALGGILGPAHPFGVATSSAMGFKQMEMSLLRHFDFIEAFNTCEFPLSNKLAAELAENYRKPTFAGSDAHVAEYIGMACTEIDAEIKCNNDLIRAVKDGAAFRALGEERSVTKKAKRKEHWIGRAGFAIYNRGIGKLIFPYRSYHHRKLSQTFRARTHFHS